MSEVLYRKWRPQSFTEVVGQEPVTRTLRNSIASGRLAHAYLFCGPRGTGKTTLGRLLAKAVNCASPAEGEPCNACDSCRAFIEGRAIDFVEQDAASHNSVDDVRQLRENVVLTPMSGKRKVYLLDEVHMLSNAAENALLKTLEEPPPHITFVLATTEPHKVSATIISRCQRFDLRRIPLSSVVERLTFVCEQEGYEFDGQSLEEIARSSTGSLRDAINGLEQAVSYYGRSPTYEQVQAALGLSVDARSGQLARLALDGDLPGGLRLIGAVRDDGVDMRQFCKQVVNFLRGLLLVKTGAAEALDLPREMTAEIKKEAATRDRDQILSALRTFGRVDFRDDFQSSLPIELALVEMVSAVEAGARQNVEAQAVAPKGAPEARVSKPEPQFSIPAAELDDVASTVASTSLGATPEEPAGPFEEATSAREGGGLLDQVRQICKETDKALAALLNGSCEVRSVSDDQVVLGFYHTFHLERAESEPNAGKLRELFSRALARPVRVVFEHAARSRADVPVKGGHLVRAAKELGARFVSGPTADEGDQNG